MKLRRTTRAGVPKELSRTLTVSRDGASHCAHVKMAWACNSEMFRGGPPMETRSRERRQRTGSEASQAFINSIRDIVPPLVENHAQYVASLFRDPIANAFRHLPPGFLRFNNENDTV